MRTKGVLYYTNHISYTACIAITKPKPNSNSNSNSNSNINNYELNVN